MNSFVRIGIAVGASLAGLWLFWPGSDPRSPTDLQPVAAPPPPARAVDSGGTGRFILDVPALQLRQPSVLDSTLAAQLTQDPLVIAPTDLARLVLLAENLITRADDGVRLAIDSVLQAIDPGTLSGQPPERIKEIAVDAFLRGLGPGDLPARYNSASTTLATVGRDGSWQCSTGTWLFQLAALRLPAAEFREHHFVLIYERGHVLPGYLQWTRERWHLTGLEMTVIGAGRKRYGPTTDLARVGYALRIVDAPEALLVQSLGPFITNSAEAATAVLKRTAARYDIPLAELERNIRDSAALLAESAAPGRDTPRNVMLAPWSFGIANVPPGDRLMMRIDQLDPRNRAISFSELLVILPPDATTDHAEAMFEERTDPEMPATTEPPNSSPGRMVYPWESDYPSR